MRTRVAVCAVLLAAAPVAAQPPPTVLALHPAAEPVPALKFRLLPSLEDLAPGNAALLYQRGHSAEWFYHRRMDVWDRIDEVIQQPLADLPRKDLDWLLGYKALKEVDLAARREQCNWEMTGRLKEDGIGLQTPDVQVFREYGILLAARARLEMADGHFDQAAYSLQTGFTLARHVADYSVLITSLVGIAIAHGMLDQLEAWVQAPGAPNLYWALADLPRPLVDLRRGMQGDRLLLQGTVRWLWEMDKAPLGPQQQKELRGMMIGTVNDGASEPAWRRELKLMSVVARDYPEAKRALIARGRKPAEVEALAPLQVVAIQSLYDFQRMRDDLYKWFNLPYWEAHAGLTRTARQMQEAQANQRSLPFLVLLPSVGKLHFSGARLDRRIAGLRCVEAVRLYAAAHGGQLPARLSDVQDVPLPADPVTGKPFEYACDGRSATLYGPPPAGEEPRAGNTLKYELTLAR
jgi:hypothetical protein